MTMPQSGQPIPKPEPAKRVKARKAREDAKKLKAFRDAVWKRERFDVVEGVEIAKCQHCGRVVGRDSHGQSADVHHIVGRRIKATRYDPVNGALLCNGSVNDCHGKVQRHEVDL